MLKENLQNRFTAKWWDDIAVEPEKLEYVLDCIHSSPVKNGKYFFNTYVITDSEEGRKLKEWLYWENTWCLVDDNLVSQGRLKEGPGLKRYNGQVLAPVVLLWVADTLKFENREDCMVSAAVGMCAALEQGLQTGFNSCLGDSEVTSHMNIPGYAVTALGLGYATTDKTPTRNVIKDNKVVGYDNSNVDPSIRFTKTRKNRPSRDSFFKYI